jgi:hypothetical protein
MDLITRKRLIAQGKTLLEALQSGMGCDGVRGRIRVKNRLKPLDYELPHGGLPLGCGNFHTL